jgi:hypothetical protein
MGPWTDPGIESCIKPGLRLWMEPGMAPWIGPGMLSCIKPGTAPGYERRMLSWTSPELEVGSCLEYWLAPRPKPGEVRLAMEVLLGVLDSSFSDGGSDTR